MLQRLYPVPPEMRPLKGLYLDLPLGSSEPALFCYSNFVASLDGRIATGTGAEQQVPREIANSRDWRLFQELAARADVLVVSGAYLRAAGATAYSPLPLSPEPEFADLHAWRQSHGLPPQPDVVVVSAQLGFTLPRGWRRQGRRVLVATTATAAPSQVAALERDGAAVVACGRDAVDGAALRRLIEASGYHRAYCLSGPLVLRTLLAGGALDSLFLTTVPRLLGGTHYSTLLEGAELQPPAQFRLRWLYLDANAGCPQQFARYDLCTPV